jgi:cytoskeletal protein CcmA (bactofilin family)
MKNYINIQNQDYSFFGKDSKLSGVFHLSGVTHINSSMDGELFIIDKSKLIIERDGHFQGTLAAHDIDIHGHFEGKIESTGIVTVFPTAILTGLINARDLVIHSGGTINIEGHTETELLN